MKKLIIVVLLLIPMFSCDRKVIPLPIEYKLSVAIFKDNNIDTLSFRSNNNFMIIRTRRNTTIKTIDTLLLVTNNPVLIIERK